MAIAKVAGRGLFFDLDGTLADSLGVLRQVYFRFLEKFGRMGSDLEFKELNGPNLKEIVSILRARHGLAVPAEDLLAIYDHLIDEAYRDVSPLPGALDLLETAARKSWTLVLVTSNSRSRAQAWLAGHGFSSLLQMLVSSEEVRRGKPFPDLYQCALSRGGCLAADSIAVEDSPQGAQAALGAGLRTFVIRSQIEKTAIWSSNVEFIDRWADLRPWI
ncbi:MAG: HAD family phosphatase [Verrucomicrobia bacterium]|nr:HAD family phosphatase [Verrucomicrobiota bacterium]